jgi:hypothetical protein
VLVSCAATLTGNPFEETVNVLEEWVKTERLITEETAGWEADRASMQNLIAVYQNEIDTLAQLIADAEKDTSAAEQRRASLLEQDASLKAIEAQAAAILARAEGEILKLKVVLPPPLQEELQPLFSSIPQDPATTKLSIGQRIQPVVAILTHIQKFNQVVTVVEDFREFESGRTVQTETVYFGLGAAFYIDQADEHAGIGIPGETGWQWREDLSVLSAVRSFIDIYRGTQQARYVELPVSIQ